MEDDFSPTIEKQIPDPLYRQFAHYTLELLVDPSGDFKPGAKFCSLDIITHAASKMRAGIRARECWEPGTTFIDKKYKHVWRVNDSQHIEEVRIDDSLLPDQTAAPPAPPAMHPDEPVH